jgi:hypothetical protein
MRFLRFQTFLFLRDPGHDSFDSFPLLLLHPGQMP